MPQLFSGSQQPKRFKWIDLLHSKTVLFLTAAAITILAYSNSLNSYFFLDDYLHLERTTSLTISTLARGWQLKALDLKPFWWVPSDIVVMYFRPLISLVFSLDQELWGTSAAGYHFTNFIFHLLAAWLVYQIGLLIFRNHKISFLACFFFLLHPVHIGAVQWISGRTDVIMTFFYLLAFHSYLKSRVSSKSKTFYSAVSLVSFALALLSKESAISFPLLILLTEFFLMPEMKANSALSRRDFHLFLATLLVLAAYLAKVLPDLALNKLPQPYFTTISFSSIPILLLKLFLYLLSCIFLIPILPFHNADIWRNHASALAITGILFFILSVFVWRKYIKSRAFVFFALWFIITLLPTISIMMGQRLAYLSSVGFCFLLGIICCSYKWQIKIRNSIFNVAKMLPGALAILFATVTFVQGQFLVSLSQQSYNLTRKIAALEAADYENNNLYLVNAWMPCSLWISQAVRQVAQNPFLKVTVLSLSPEMLPSAYKIRDPITYYLLRWLYLPARDDFTLHVKTVDEHTLRLEADKAGFFDSQLMQFFLLGRNNFSENQLFITEDFSARIAGMQGSSVKQIDFVFEDLLSESNSIFLRCDDLELKFINFKSDDIVKGQ